MFDHKAFSLTMKSALSEYLFGDKAGVELDENALQALSDFNPNELSVADAKKAFWINLYNGLTNYQIISNQLHESVWEVPGFFTGRIFKVGGLALSLDDIEHGILRNNGPRRNGKPRQYQEDDPRAKWMLEQFDPRIHFALNCGSVSCPPIAFYSTENIDGELAIAEENFVSQEFVVNLKERVIRCSELFVWYRNDFPGRYLNSPELQGYTVIPKAYRWTIK